MDNRMALLDDEFLIKLFTHRDRTTWVKAIALDAKDQPMQELVGRATGGSINVDGNSNVRRSCSLTMVAENVDINPFYWGLQSRIRVEAGLTNNVPDNNYPGIIWFKQGTFILTAFNVSRSVSNFTISLTGKDKMCLLNGEVSGQLPSSVDFGQEEVVENSFQRVVLTDTSTDYIMSKQYYFKPKEDELNTIHEEDFSYAFAEDNSGQWKKEGQNYIKDSGYQGVRYQIYQRIKKPEDIQSTVIVTTGNSNTPSLTNYTSFKYQLSDDTSVIAGKQYYLKDQNNDYYFPIAVIENPEETNPHVVEYYELKVETAGENEHGQAQQYELYELEQKTTLRKMLIKDIILNLVHTYAQEPYENIIIRDLDITGLELLTYKGDVPLYGVKDGDEVNNLQFEQPSSGQYNVYEFGDDVCYRETDLTYAGELIAKIGENATSILDKLKNMLVHFEYFYDIDGRFIFQQKKDYVSTRWSPMLEDGNGETFISPLYAAPRKFAFSFDNNGLLTSVQKTPNLANIKNDFTVWGKKKSISGATIPIHVRYAIDRKPTKYVTLTGKEYDTTVPRDYIKYLKYPWNNLTDTNENVYKYNARTAQYQKYFNRPYNGITWTNEVFNDQKNEYNNLNDADKDFYYAVYWDWRELIYQMALDYRAAQGLLQDPNHKVSLGADGYLKNIDEFTYWVGKRNPDYYPSGITGYEQYYTDVFGFWRQLYNPGLAENPKQIVTEAGSYQQQQVFNDNTGFYSVQKIWQDEKVETIDEFDKTTYWHKKLESSPSSFVFWFDFINDQNNELQEFSVKTIGDRAKVVNDDKVNAIAYKEVPNLLLYTTNIETPNTRGYPRIQVPDNMMQYFSISTRGSDAKSKIDDLLYQHAYKGESLSLSCVPILNLEPNSRIFVYEKDAGINGEYLVNKISIPLKYNGTQSITATKAPPEDAKLI